MDFHQAAFRPTDFSRWLLALLVFSTAFSNLEAADALKTPSLSYGHRKPKEITVLRSLNPDGHAYLNCDDVKLALVYFQYHALFDHQIKQYHTLRPEDRALINDIVTDERDLYLSTLYRSIQEKYPQLVGNGIVLTTTTDLPDPTALGLPPTGVFDISATSIAGPGSEADEKAGDGDERFKKPYSWGLWQTDKDLTLANDILSSQESAPANAKPAQFGFGDNFTAGQVSYSAKGVLVGEYQIPVASQDEMMFQPAGPNEPYIPAVQLLPAVGFDRTYLHDVPGSTASKAAQTNELDFNLGTQWEVDRVAMLDAENSSYDQIFKFGFHHVTDWDFNADINGAEFDAQPMFGAFNYKTFGKLLRLRWVISTHFEGGAVGNTGTYSHLEANSDFFRIGEYAQVNLSPGYQTRGWENLSLVASYYYYQTVFSSAPSVHAYDINASYYLDQKQNCSLTLDYTDGVQDLTLKPTRTLNLGLGLKY